MMGMVQWLASYQEKGLRTRAKQQMRELGSARPGRMVHFPRARGNKSPGRVWSAIPFSAFSVNHRTEECYSTIIIQVKLPASS